MTDDQRTPGSWPPVERYWQGGTTRAIEQPSQPDWVTPSEREENYHLALREVFETSPLSGVSSFGPEVPVAGRKVDVVVDVDCVGDSPWALKERIGIEVKSSADAFETSTDNLEQVSALAKTGAFDRLYVCTPATGHETRLDIDPEGTSLVNKKDFIEKAISFRGLEGTVSTPDGREISKSAYYRQEMNKHPDRIWDILERHGDLEQVRENLEEYDEASLSSKEYDRGDEWVDPILRNVGILRYDATTGSITCQRPAQFLDTEPTFDLKTNCVRESDIVYAVWKHYQEQIGAAIATEVKIPSLPTGCPNRIDLVATADETVGIEVKGPDPDPNHLLNEQLPSYTRAQEFKEIIVAVPAAISETVRRELAATDEYIGILEVSDPLGNREVTRIR